MTPDYRLSIDGNPAGDSLKDRLISLSITDRRGMEADSITLAISDHDGKVAMPRRGAIITCALGWQGDVLSDMGQFTVDEIEHSGPPDVMTITGRSADMRTSLTEQRSQSYHDKTLTQILEEVAGRHQLAPAIGSLGNQTITHLDQTDESDAHLLTRLGLRFDAVATVKHGRLLFLPAGTGLSKSGQAIGSLTIHRSDGDQHRYTEQDRDAKYTGTKAAWHDQPGAQRKYAEAGSDGYIKTLKETYPTEAEAKAAAEAEWNRLQRGSKALSLVLSSGNAQLSAETPVIVSGYKTEVTRNAWIVHEVKHQLGDAGFTTAVELEVKL